MHPIPHGPGAHRKDNGFQRISQRGRAPGELGRVDGPPLGAVGGKSTREPVSGCEANDQGDYTGGHCSPPPSPPPLGIALKYSSRPFGNDALGVAAVTATAFIDGRRIVAEPTIHPPQIEQTCTGFMVMAARPKVVAPFSRLSHAAGLVRTRQTFARQRIVGEP